MSIKTIHRIFFGFGGEKDLYLPYLELWKKALPEYKIKLWNADNLPLDLNPWTKKMTELQDGVFLSDFFRWWVCNEYGGIYLDADIEVFDGAKFDALIDELEKSQEYDSLIGIETPIGGYTSHSFACKKNSKLANYMCNLYANLDVLSIARKKMLVGPHITNLYFWEQGIGNRGNILSKTPIVEAGVKILPLDFFSPLQYGAKPSLEYLSHNTCLAHHYGGSWFENDSAMAIQRDAMKSTLQKSRPKLLQDYILEQNTPISYLKRNAKKSLKYIVNKIILPKGSRRRDFFRKIFFSMVEI